MHVSSILCNQKNPTQGMRWPHLSSQEYLQLFVHNLLNSIPVVQTFYALYLTWRYRDNTSCAMRDAHYLTYVTDDERAALKAHKHTRSADSVVQPL